MYIEANSDVRQTTSDSNSKCKQSKVDLSMKIQSKL